MLSRVLLTLTVASYQNFISFTQFEYVLLKSTTYNSLYSVVATTPTSIVTTRKVGLAIRAAWASKLLVLHFFLSSPSNITCCDLERPSIVNFPSALDSFSTDRRTENARIFIQIYTHLRFLSHVSPHKIKYLLKLVARYTFSLTIVPRILLNNWFVLTR